MLPAWFGEGFFCWWLRTPVGRRRIPPATYEISWELIPKLPARGRRQPGSTLTESGIRAGAERAGYPTTHAQFQNIQKWGLLPQLQDGQYTLEAVSRLIEVRKLGKEVRSLPRRALRLRRRYSIPANRTREAILWVIPEIRRPRRKLKKLARLLHHPPGADDRVLIRATKLQVPRWKELVKDFEDDQALDDLVSFVYYFLANLPWWLPEAEAQLAKEIPASEERMILLLVLNLARKADALNAATNRVNS